MPKSRVIDLANFQQFQAINVLSDPGAIPGPVVVPTCAQIAIRYGNDANKSVFNVLYGRYSGTFTGTAAQATSIMTGLSTGAAWTALAAFIPTNSGITAVTLRDVNTPNNAIIQSTGTSVLGTSASPALPAEVALVATLRTAFVGPQFRGRLYFPLWATNALGAGNVASAGAVTALQNWVNTIASVFAGQGYTWVLGQKARAQYTGSTGRVHPARSATSTPITSSPVRDNHWDTQRRRGLK